jgi:hypothetical protein
MKPSSWARSASSGNTCMVTDGKVKAEIGCAPRAERVVLWAPASAFR